MTEEQNHKKNCDPLTTKSVLLNQVMIPKIHFSFLYSKQGSSV